MAPSAVFVRKGIEPGLDATLRDIHADPVLRQQLQFWLGRSILAEALFPGVQARDEAAMAALERELARTR